MTREQAAQIVVEVLAQTLDVPAEELASKPQTKLRDDLGMTSMQYFPFIGELEERLDLEIDYSAFLTAAVTIDDSIDFICEMTADK